MPSKPKNRVGEVYGKLTVVRISERRTKSGNAFWWCRCDCGREREVPGDKLSHNTSRKKPVVSACLQCSRELQIEAVTIKNDRDEVRRREEAPPQPVGELHVAANGVGVVQEDGLLVCL